MRYIWLLTVDVGIVFLMETSQIEDQLAVGYWFSFYGLVLVVSFSEAGSLLEEHIRINRSSILSMCSLAGHDYQLCCFGFHSEYR